MSSIPPVDAPLIICSTARLAQSLREAHGREQLAQAQSQWQPLQAMTWQQWLDNVIEQALLSGLVPLDKTPRGQLNATQERILWEQAIAESLQQETLGVLFDQAGMASAAMEANRLLLEWNIVLDDGELTEETRQFMSWREYFRQRCKQSGWLEPARYIDWQIAHLQNSAGLIPKLVYLAGFDRISPQQQRLFDVLIACGAELRIWSTGLSEPAMAAQISYDDAEAECRAAAAWAKHKLAANPQTRLAIVVPQLAKLRARLAAILDDSLQPQTVHAEFAEMARCYDFSLGEPLANYPLVSTALALLRLVVQRYRFNQGDVSYLLRDVYWSGAEADVRASLEARMRRKLPASLSLEQLLRLVHKAQLDGLALSGLISQLEAMQQQAREWPRKQLVSAWVSSFSKLLEVSGWPGERSLSSHEYQTQKKWREILAGFAKLDDLLGNLDAAQALGRLSQICREDNFQPKAEAAPSLLVSGMLEAAATPLDAIWVMGMNDHQWPPPPSPNALLPAGLQRAAGTPNADNKVQAEFAADIHKRLLHSAPELVFSWAHKDGERELRMSPLLHGLPQPTASFGHAATLAEQLAQPAQMQRLDDHRAPPVAENENLRGGTGLLRAQAICPAWAFYQYRLGARALDEPLEGLDAMARGSLLHAVLQCFWQGRDSDWLNAMLPDELTAAIEKAVEEGVQLYSQQQEQTLPANFMVLERARLKRLLSAWLLFEQERSPFSVKACELELSQPIAGMHISLKLDRVDELADGALVVIDYKTGGQLDYKSWAEDRIAEPQLPIYAALAMHGEQVAAVCFARVRPHEQAFVGVASNDDVLPGLKGLDSARKVFAEDKFPDWAALLAHWQTSILAIAEEIKAGEAAVKYEKEADLAYCEVKPLLRLPERALQLEQMGGSNE